MGNSDSFAVIVVGATPGGSVVAKRCVESGLTTLLIEKKKLLRDKVCTGMVMGSWARDIITSEFGQILQTALVNPPHLSGHVYTDISFFLTRYHPVFAVLFRGLWLADFVPGRPDVSLLE